MDYTTAPLLFKVKKAIRYVGMYGLPRTIVKVRAQYHMKQGGSVQPTPPSQRAAGGTIAFIGAGSFAFSTLAYYANKSWPGQIRCVMDVDLPRAESLAGEYGARYFTNDASAVISDPEVRLVFVASNHASHAEYAIEALRAGKHVHIEKPHVVSWDQLQRLASAMRENPASRVFLGFNRPRSPHFRELKARLSAENGPLMINWFVAGHELPDNHWYFSEAEGGRVLGNLCHWTDLTLLLVGLGAAFPCRIVPGSPTGSRSDFIVNLSFADGSCAAITFSAKGHTFEGVRESLNVHRGNVLATLTDFHHLRIDEVDRMTTRKLRLRDYGHEANILNSLAALSPDGVGEEFDYVIATAALFLAIRDALTSGRAITVGKTGRVDGE
jgi:predicted dehydrogenase